MQALVKDSAMLNQGEWFSHCNSWPCCTWADEPEVETGRGEIVESWAGFNMHYDLDLQSFMSSSHFNLMSSFCLCLFTTLSFPYLLWLLLPEVFFSFLLLLFFFFLPFFIHLWSVISDTWTNPHETWYGCSPTWLIWNRRFVSLDVRFPWC